MREFINAILCEDAELLSFWDAAAELGCEEAARNINDLSIPWINHNRVSAIHKLIRDPEMALQSKLRYYLRYIINHDNFGDPIIDLNSFQQALSQSITIWRGGGGIYDLLLPKRSWVSFTAKKDRTTTFSQYDGTFAMRAWRLPERRGPWWVAELEIPLGEILLYMPHGLDEEVIVPKSWSRKARVIATNEGPVDA